MKLLSKMALLLATTFVLSSCGDDDDDDNGNGNGNNQPANFLKIGENEFKFGANFVLDYGTDPMSGLNYDVNLVTDGINIIYDNQGFPDSATGSGYVVYLEFFSADTTTLAAGAYVVDSTYLPGTIGYAEVFEVIDGDEGNVEYDYTGTVEVMVSGDNTTIKSTGKGDGTVDISFEYTTKFNILDAGSFKRGSLLHRK